MVHVCLPLVIPPINNCADMYFNSPTLAFLLFGVISGAVSLFLVETMSTIHGNEAFQARVEYSTVAHLYMGDRAHVFMQVLLYCALQSVNLSSIIISEQVRMNMGSWWWCEADKAVW